MGGHSLSTCRAARDLRRWASRRSCTSSTSAPESSAARASEILATLPADTFGHELQQSTVEINTRVWRTLDDLDRDIRQLRRDLGTVTRPRRLGLAAVGTVPLDNSPGLDVTPTRRFTRMHEDYQLLVEEQLICGTQVHVGVEDRDVAVAVSQRVLGWLPVLLALSASSPYWHGLDTGYASIRTMIWQRWPTAGATGPIAGAADYDALVADLIATGVIADAKMAYFDVRPSSARADCGASSVRRVPARRGRHPPGRPVSRARRPGGGVGQCGRTAAPCGRGAGTPRGDVAGGAQRSQRRACRARSACARTRGGRGPRAAGELRPQLTDFGDWDVVRQLATDALARGTSAERQRAALRRRGRLTDIVDQVVAETETAHVLEPPRAHPVGKNSSRPASRSSTATEWGTSRSATSIPRGSAMRRSRSSAASPEESK